jgi:hypothetical protein
MHPDGPTFSTQRRAVSRIALRYRTQISPNSGAGFHRDHNVEDLVLIDSKAPGFLHGSMNKMTQTLSHATDD